MIRFCDKEVSCVSIECLNRAELFDYFLNGRRDELVCIVGENSRFYGMITYTSLLQSDNMVNCIRTERVLLDENIWMNGRTFFQSINGQLDERALLPVVNKEGQLLCFAYQDQDANREIRQLRELMACKNKLNFRDVFPEYDCVTIYECNELAYFFALYLKSIGISVNVRGNYWEVFGSWDSCETLDYRNLCIYSEGTWEKSQNLRENLLRSVSVEFECVDKIYEANIKMGYIRNGGIGQDELLSRLYGKKVYLIGTSIEAQDAYDMFLRKGLDICGFTAQTQDDIANGMLFGKPIVSFYESEAVLVDCYNEYSAWGAGDTDFFDYLGYCRNERFFMLKDWCGCQVSMLKHVLHNKRLVLMGDQLLCKKVFGYMIQQEWKFESLYYFNVMNEELNTDFQLNQIQRENIRENDMCLLIVPEYFTVTEKTTVDGTRDEYIAKMKSLGIHNYSTYFSHARIYIEIACQSEKYMEKLFIPKGILLGAIHPHSGNILIRDILDGHPDVLQMDYNFLNNNLLSFCIRLAGEKSENISSLFWKICKQFAGKEEMDAVFPWKEKFKVKLSELLQQKDIFTSQELFVIFHLAYGKMWGREIDKMQGKYIYWEPHMNPRDYLDSIYAKWLSTEQTAGYTIRVSRNAIGRGGSGLNLCVRKGILYGMGTIRIILDAPNESNEDIQSWKRIDLRFEDIKIEPKKIIGELCDQIGLTWNDSLMATTRHGYTSSWNGVTGFDLKPVYNSYEDFFTEYDRMRMMILQSPWQRKHGYSYIKVTDFTRKELQDIFLKEFRCESQIKFFNEEIRLKNRLDMMNWYRTKFQVLYREEFNKNDTFL